MIEGVKVILAKPQTYMNLSGESIAEIVNFYKLDPESEMLIIFDDISLSIVGGGAQVVKAEADQARTTEMRCWLWPPFSISSTRAMA